MLRHIFTWGGVECLKGEAAQPAFEAQRDARILVFEGGHSPDGTPQIEKLRKAPSISQKELRRLSDVYITDEAFRVGRSSRLYRELHKVKFHLHIVQKRPACYTEIDS